MMTLFLFACGRDVERSDIERPEVHGVTVETVSLSTVPQIYEAPGTVMPVTRSVIASRIMAPVTAVLVKEGDSVRKGEALIRLDDRELRQKTAAAEEAMNEAKSARDSASEKKALADVTYERYSRLFEDRALTKQEYDQITMQRNVAANELQRAESALGRAEASLSEARVFLGYATITSPINGVVSSKSVDAGSMAVPGSPLITVDDRSGYRLEVNADETYTDIIKVGADVRVSIESLGKTYDGTVVEVSPSVSTDSRTFLVKISIAGDGLKGGLYGKAYFPVGEHEALMVPERAVVTKGQLKGIYVVGPEKDVSFKLVRTSKTGGGMVEVILGINPGEMIITDGIKNAVDGGVLIEDTGR